MPTLTFPNMLNLGLTVERLVQELEDNFPQFLPQPNDSQNMIMYKSGQRSVVEWIVNRLSDEDLNGQE
jgi:hypothetical protein